MKKTYFKIFVYGPNNYEIKSRNWENPPPMWFANKRDAIKHRLEIMTANRRELDGMIKLLNYLIVSGKF